MPEDAVYCGFDYGLAGREMAKRCLGDGHRNAAVFTGNTKYSNYGRFVKGIQEVFAAEGGNVRVFSSDESLQFHTAFELLTDREEFDAVIASDPEAPACLAAAASYRGQTSLPEVYAVTGKELRPFSGAIPYELNYRLCGRRIGKYIGGLEPGTADESAAAPGKRRVSPLSSEGLRRGGGLEAAHAFRPHLQGAGTAAAPVHGKDRDTGQADGSGLRRAVPDG